MCVCVCVCVCVCNPLSTPVVASQNTSTTSFAEDLNIS